MSKFFNESRGAHRTTPVSSEKSLNIHDLVGALKRAADSDESSSPRPADTDLKHFLRPLDGSNDVTVQIAANRLEKCRSIRLPRTEDKSFLISQYNPAMQAAVEAYRTLRTRLVKQQTKNGTRSLVISSAAQGEGKTLTSFNLALCYAKIQNWPVLLVDSDLRTCGLSEMLGNPGSPGLAGILEDNIAYESAILETEIPGLHVLPAGSSTISPPELFSKPNWKEFLGWASETFRLVIVDSPPALNLADLELVMAPCESVVLVVRARKTSRESLAKILSEIDAKKLAGVIFNAAEESSGQKYYSYSAANKTNGT